MHICFFMFSESRSVGSDLKESMQSVHICPCCVCTLHHIKPFVENAERELSSGVARGVQEPTVQPNTLIKVLQYLNPRG